MTDAARSPGSTIDDGRASEIDDQRTMPASSPSRPDPRTSLQHVLAASSPRNTPAPKPSAADFTEDEDRTPGPVAADTPVTITGGPGRKKKEAVPNTQPNTIYSGNKVRHLKKDDGEPLWRKDIQYDFLKAVFDDDTACFTNSYEPLAPKQTFANLYIDAMARSSKTSKILRDKLLTEHEPAKNMAMVCLLVNLGRMNTTLNFFPEMRAQLRTYHAIPSLQAHQDPNSYKQLQDAPRLKSILKGASEDRPEPNTLDKIKAKDIPRTNPVNLIFVLSQFAPKVTELHFPPGRDFYDLIMRTHISSKSRATAFLWLMWFYLESDFTEEGAEENAFGPGIDYDVDVRNQGVPRFTYLTQEQEEAENLDSAEELEYGFQKMKERKRIIEADQAAFQAEHGPPKRGPKPKLHLPPEGEAPSFMGRVRALAAGFVTGPDASPSGSVGRIRPRYESDIDSTRSTPPPRAIGANVRLQNVLHSGKGRGSLKHQIAEGSSPIEPALDRIPQMRRSRPLTAHQLAVERNRNQRVDYILSRGIRKKHHHSRKVRRQEGVLVRALKRTSNLIDPFDDSEGEDYMVTNPAPFRARGFGGLVQLLDEEDDYGEEMSSYAAALRRMGRRLARWDEQKDMNLGVMGTGRANGHNVAHDADETEDEVPQHGRSADEDLDDMDKEILGLASEAEDDEELNEDEKASLAMAGDADETEEDSDAMEVD